MVGALLIAPEGLAVVQSILEESDIASPLAREAYRAICALDASAQAVDLATVRRQLEVTGSRYGTGAGVAELAALTDGVPRATNVESYAGQVADASLIRRVRRAAEDVIAATEGGGSVDEILTQAQAAMLAIGQGRQRSRGLRPLVEGLRDLCDHIAACRAGQVADAIAYGLPDLDQMTGGMHAGDLIVLGARPSVGKSAFALHVARAAAMGGSGSIAVFSIEMVSRQVVQRFIASQACVALSELRQGKLSEAVGEMVIRAMASAKDWPIWIDDAGTISVVEIEARARRLKADHGLSLIVVDYLQLIKAARAENRTAEVGAISRGLKGMAKALGVPVLALAQLNRAAEDVRPLLSHLRESGDIEADADAVLLLWRPVADDRSSLEVVVAKQRHGPTGSVPLYFREEYQQFACVGRDESGERD